MLFSHIRSQRLASAALLGALLVTSPIVLSGCDFNRAEKKLAEDAKQLENENFDTDLTFNSVTLEDFDKEGKLWWKVKAEQATYSRDKKVAKVKKPNGEFYQDGKAIIKVSAEGGEVLQDGKRIFLRGNIVATDTRDGLVLKGNELEWQPEKDLIFIRNNVTGSRQKMTAAAKSGKYFTRARRLELDGAVAAESKDPNFRFNTDRLVWLVEKDQLIGEKPLKMERYAGNVVTDRAAAAQGEMNIKTEVVTLKQAAQLNIVDPPIQVNGNLVEWKIKERLITSTQPITITNAKDRVTLVGNQGDLDLKTQVLTLVGNVNGSGGPNQSQLKSDRLVWNINTQAFQADGNVTYRQAKPPLNLAGPSAAGTLKDQQVVVSGGRVVTEFVP